MSDIDTMIDRLSPRQQRQFALWCAERVRHLMTDPRSTHVLDVAARHLRGEATDEELAAARYAAWDAARAAARAAAWSAALAAARDAARDAARAAALAAALHAALHAARSAAWDAALAAAWDAERAAQRIELERMAKEVQP